MKCAYSKCKNEGMQWNFIRITKPGQEDVFYCSQKCFNKDNKVKFIYGRDSKKVINKRKEEVKK